MFISIRRFSAQDHATASALVAEEFVPMLMAIDGIEAYRLIDTGDALISITTGVSEDAIRASDEASAAFVAAHYTAETGKLESIHEGPVICSVG